MTSSFWFKVVIRKKLHEQNYMLGPQKMLNIYNTLHINYGPTTFRTLMFPFSYINRVSDANIVYNICMCVWNWLTQP